MFAILSRSRACTVEAREPSSTTSTVLLKAARMSRSPLSVSRPSATPALRARNPCRVSLATPASSASVRAADADGARPLTSKPRFSSSTLARFSIVVLPLPA